MRTLAALLTIVLLGAAASAGAQAPVPVTSTPFVETFDGAALDAAWELTPDLPQGRVTPAIGAFPSPGSGGLALLMDSLQPGVPAANEAALHVDLVASGAAILLYRVREEMDEDDPGEGLWLDDGATEILVASHAGLAPGWNEIEVDLLAAAAAGGLSVADPLRIVFRQTSDALLPMDGVLIDDVRLLPPGGSGQANGPGATLDLNQGLDANGLPAAPGRPGPFFASGPSLDLLVASSPNRPFLLLFGALGVGNAAFPGIGQLDLGALGPGNLGDVAILLDGNAPSSTLDLFARTGPDGTAALFFGLPGFPPGPLGAFQVAVFDGSPAVLALSAAFEMTVSP